MKKQRKNANVFKILNTQFISQCSGFFITTEKQLFEEQ